MYGILRLFAEQIVIQAFLLHQFVMCSFFNAFSVIDHNDLICCRSGRQAMRNIYDAFISAQVLHFLKQTTFRIGV